MINTSVFLRAAEAYRLAFKKRTAAWNAASSSIPDKDEADRLIGEYQAARDEFMTADHALGQFLTGDQPLYPHVGEPDVYFKALVEIFAKREFSRLSHERRCQFVQKKGTTYTTLSKRLPEEVVKRMVSLAEDWVVDELTPKMGEVKGKVQG